MECLDLNKTQYISPNLYTSAAQDPAISPAECADQLLKLWNDIQPLWWDIFFQLLQDSPHSAMHMKLTGLMSRLKFIRNLFVDGQIICDNRSDFVFLLERFQPDFDSAFLFLINLGNPQGLQQQ